MPSSSEDVTRAMRGQPKRFSRNYLRRNGRNVILYVFVSFHTRVVFWTFSRVFVWPGFRLFFCLFGCSLFCRLFGFREFLKLSKLYTATATSTMAVWACVITLCSFLRLSLQKFTQQEREIATFCTFERTWTIRRLIFSGAPAARRTAKRSPIPI